MKISKYDNSFINKEYRKKYFQKIIIFFIFSIFLTIGILIYKNPIPISSPSFIPLMKRRIYTVVAIIVSSICHSLSTITFQTITNNKIITPSLLGFESLYTFIQTSTIYFFGLTALINFSGKISFIIQILLMVLLSVVLYGFLIVKKNKNIQFILFVGIIISSGLKSASSFMSRLLNPNEFDILQSRLFASVSNIDSENFIIIIPLLILVVFILFKNSGNLNVISLGKDISINLGINYKQISLNFLIIVSLLMSISTSLIGPINFFGFLSAMITYQVVKTFDHKYMFPMSILISYLILGSSYFIMQYVFYAQGVVSIIIELFGGLLFLFILLRKGNL